MIYFIVRKTDIFFVRRLNPIQLAEGCELQSQSSSQNASCNGKVANACEHGKTLLAEGCELQMAINIYKFQ